MALQVWLPLNGDLHNQGLSGLTFSALDSYCASNNSGKIGKCYNNDAPSWNRGGLRSSATIDLGQNQSMFCWVNFTTLDSSSSLGGGIISQHRYSTNKGMGLTIKYVSATTGYLSVNTGTGSSRTCNTYCATTLMQAGIWYHVGYTYDGATLKLYVNGNVEKTQAISGMSVPAEYLTVFCWSMDGSSGSSVYTAHYKLNGKLNDVRVYDHCLSPKEVEEIAKGLVLHYQLGGENQILVPSGYQQLEYIESTGSSWLNTGYIFNPETDAFKVVFQGNDTSNNGMIFASNGSKYTWLYYYSAGMRIYITNSSGSQTSVAGPSRDTNKHTAIYQNKHYYFDGVDKGGLSGSYVSDTNSIYLFAYTGSGTNYAFKGRIYSVEIMRNSIIQKIFVPAKQLSDNAIGMYEVLSKSFIPSMTATAFTAGPNAPITGTIYDSSGYANNGTIVGSLTAAAGSPRYDVATVFDGASRINSATLGGEIQTLSCWAKTTKNKSTSQQMVSDSASGLTISFYNGTIISYFGSSGHGTGSKCTLGSEYKENEWNHFVVVKTGAGTRDVYCNGVKLTPTTNDYWGAATGFFVGARNTSNGNPFYGSIVDVRAYATALTVAQIKELYNTSMLVDASGNVSPRGLGDLI